MGRWEGSCFPALFVPAKKSIWQNIWEDNTSYHQSECQSKMKFFFLKQIRKWPILWHMVTTESWPRSSYIPSGLPGLPWSNRSLWIRLWALASSREGSHCSRPAQGATVRPSPEAAQGRSEYNSAAVGPGRGLQETGVSSRFLPLTPPCLPSPFFISERTTVALLGWSREKVRLSQPEHTLSEVRN